VKIDLEGPHPIVPGDVFLMCSDGLSGQVRDDELGMILASMPPAEAARSLIDIANMRGGPDNITVVVAKTAGQTWTQTSTNEMPRSRSVIRPVNPNVWIALGVLALASVLLLLMQQWIAGAVTLAVAAAFGIITWIYRNGGEVQGPAMNGNRFGRGPYTAIVCTPSKEFVQRLAEMLRDLREAAARDDLTFDSAALNAKIDRAAAESQSGDYAQAVRYYCHAISFLVAEFKRQGKSRK
jgi:protein phosphatase